MTSIGRISGKTELAVLRGWAGTTQGHDLGAKPSEGRIPEGVCCPLSKAGPALCLARTGDHDTVL